MQLLQQQVWSDQVESNRAKKNTHFLAPLCVSHYVLSHHHHLLCSNQ